MRSTIAILFGTLLEWAALGQLLGDSTSGHDFALFTCVHLTATGVIAVGCHGFLPSREAQPHRDVILVYCALLVLCLPLLGELAVISLLFTLWLGKGKPSTAWQTTDVPELPARTNTGKGERYGEAALMGILCHSRNPEKRLRAVLATRQLEPRAALPLLRRALNDASEDVRLLAFSQLDSKQESLNQQIKAILTEMDESPDIIHDPNMLATMASRFWELVYLGFNNTQGDISLLDRAREHLLRAIDNNPTDAELHFQIGRIELKLGDLDKAREAFNNAERGGYCTDELMPYLAECAFLTGNYRAIRPLLDRIDAKRRRREPFNALVALWA